MTINGFNPNVPVDTNFMANFPALWRSDKTAIKTVLSSEHDFDNTNNHLPTSTRIDNDTDNLLVTPQTNNIKAFTPATGIGMGLKYWNGTAWQLFQIGTDQTILATGSVTLLGGMSYLFIATSNVNRGSAILTNGANTLLTLVVVCAGTLSTGYCQSSEIYTPAADETDTLTLSSINNVRIIPI